MLPNICLGFKPLGYHQYIKTNNSSNKKKSHTKEKVSLSLSHLYLQNQIKAISLDSSNLQERLGQINKQ